MDKTQSNIKYTIREFGGTLPVQGCCLELPIFVDRFDGPVELLTQGLGEELLDRNVEPLGEDGREAGVDIILVVTLDVRFVVCCQSIGKQILTILEVPSATSLLSSLS